MSYSKRTRIGLAMGVFVILSLVVFGALYCIAFSACDVEILTDTDGGIGTEDHHRSISYEPIQSVRRGDIEYVPDCDPILTYSVRRGSIEYVPYYNPYYGNRRGPIEILPEYNPFLIIRRPPVVISPF